MDYAEADKLVKQLSTGFETLQEEYQKLFGRHEALERKLATARDQVSTPIHRDITPSPNLHLYDEQN
jgi:cell division septum initiation protein DivIVA